MSVPLTINGVTFQYPQEFDKHWGPVLTNWSTAVTNGMLQTSGINAASLIKSATANPSGTGFLRLAKTDAISWRNNANSADLPLAINSSNQLTFNGTPIGASTALTNGHIFVGNASNQPADVAMSGNVTISNTGTTTIGAGQITNSMIVSSAGIAINKLAALTASQIVVTDGSGFLTNVSSPSLTELGYLAGVTSAIQTQINALTTSLGNYLPLVGGTMSGTINMASHKILSVSNGTSSGDAVNFSQITGQRVIQTVQSAGTVTQVTTASSSTAFTATNITATITPTTNTSKIRISVTTSINTNGSAETGIATIERNGSNLGSSTQGMTFWDGGSGVNGQITMVYLDSPASTSALTYTVYIRSLAGTNQVTCPAFAAGGSRGNWSNILLEEIG